MLCVVQSETVEGHVCCAVQSETVERHVCCAVQSETGSVSLCMVKSLSLAECIASFT